jgi:hypothetical protein
MGHSMGKKDSVALIHNVEVKPVFSVCSETNESGANFASLPGQRSRRGQKH